MFHFQFRIELKQLELIIVVILRYHMTMSDVRASLFVSAHCLPVRLFNCVHFLQRDTAKNHNLLGTKQQKDSLQLACEHSLALSGLRAPGVGRDQKRN